MLAWMVRGLRKGRVTTRYPRAPEEPPPGFQGLVDVLDDADADRDVADVCPTGAIAVDGSGRVRLDRGRCILCGACVRAEPERFTFRDRYETGSRRRSDLIVGADLPDDPEPLRRTLAQEVRALRRSVHIRHVDAGSDGAEEWEIAALLNPYYDIQRLGMFFTSAPRHADVLLVTGGVTVPMRAPLLRAWEVMPAPKAVVAVGTDACSGGLCPDSGWTMGGADAVLPVDVYVPGSPPSPIAILHGLLLAVGVVREATS
jgi:Ni,Fe-hydrogenase III small subunit/ferredoxin